MLVHGGMAQNVGPILEMVSEKYLLRSEAEWKARLSMLAILDEILAGLKREDVAALGAATTRNFFGPIQTIIPWATNLFTETIINRVKTEFGKDFLGFWMLGGMSGGGMGFIFDPAKKAAGQARLQEVMTQTKREFEYSLPFAMEPVVYDFAINEKGTWATCCMASPRCCRRDITRSSCRRCCGRMPAPCRRCTARKWTNSPPPAAPSPNCAAWCRRFSTGCCHA